MDSKAIVAFMFLFYFIEFVKSDASCDNNGINDPCCDHWCQVHDNCGLSGSCQITQPSNQYKCVCNTTNTDCPIVNLCNGTEAMICNATCAKYGCFGGQCCADCRCTNKDGTTCQPQCDSMTVQACKAECAAQSCSSSSCGIDLSGITFTVNCSCSDCCPFGAEGGPDCALLGCSALGTRCRFVNNGQDAEWHCTGCPNGQDLCFKDCNQCTGCFLFAPGCNYPCSQSPYGPYNKK